MNIFLKAKYLRRWKGPDGKWRYAYSTQREARSYKTATNKYGQKMVQLVRTGGMYITPDGAFEIVSVVDPSNRSAHWYWKPRDGEAHDWYDTKWQAQEALTEYLRESGKLQKARRAAIGAISKDGKRKKAAEGVWIPVKGRPRKITTGSAETRKLIDDARRYFGTTQDPTNASFILPSGEMLAKDDKEHGQVRVATDIGIEPFLRKTGAMRVALEAGVGGQQLAYIQFASPPTNEQMEMILDFGATRRPRPYSR